MKVKSLLKVCDVIDVKGSKEVEITSLTSHSQSASFGSLFIAKRGARFDANRFSQDAVMSGACAIVSDIYNPAIRTATQIIVKDVAHTEALLAAHFYEYPSCELFMIGVTGTSGKTTTSYLIRHLLEYTSSVSTGLIGTIAHIVGNTQSSALMTTSDVIFNNKMLKDMVKAGQKACVMEVSSHALDQNRVGNIDFDVAVFTNFSHEHLDYHKTMLAYAHAKNRLFYNLGKGKKSKGNIAAVINRQDPWVNEIIKGCSAPILTYGIEDREADLSAEKIVLGNFSTSFILRYKDYKVPITWNIAGRFNIANCLAAVGVALCYGVSDIQEIAHGLKTFQCPPGRLERVSNSLEISIFVDYAHKEDALQNVLSTLKECTKGKIITVFGCGGDRDKEKRPRMAQCAEKLSDIVIVTSDNPRSENPLDIIEEICRGFTQENRNYIIEPDRKKAIEQAIAIAVPYDTILIAGKGHEKEQTFRYSTIAFDDCLVAQKACQEKEKRLQQQHKR